jgi:hypothetical protein
VQDDQPVRQIAPQLVLCWETTCPPQQVHRFSETRPRGEQGLRWQVLERGDASRVVKVVMIHQRYQRASVTERHKRPAFRFAST